MTSDLAAYTSFLRGKAQTAVQTGFSVTLPGQAEGEESPSLSDPIVAALISREISITTYEGLPAAVAAASVEQLRQALELLPDDLRTGRGPVLEHALRRKGE